MLHDDRANLFLLPFMTFLSAFLSPFACDSHFVNLPATTSGIEGESVTLKCQATSLEGLEYSWTHNGRSIRNTTRVYQIGSSLYISRLNKTLDNGNYECVATSSVSGARQVSPAATLDVIWLTSTSVLKQHSPPKYKNDVILKCHVEGSGSITVEWFRNTENVQTNLNFHIDLLGRRLFILKPSTSENGVYQCSAKNEAGIVFSQTNYELRIDTNNLKPFGKKASDSIKSGLRCSYKQTKNLDKIHSNGLLNDDDDIIEIYKSIRHDNKGVYLCRGKRGDQIQEFASEITPPANIAKQSLVKLVVDENKSVILNCDITKGNKKNPILVKWKKDGKPFRQVDINSPTSSPPDLNTDTTMLREDSRITANRKNGSLVFTSVVSNDVGSYECQTYNEQEMQISSRKTELKIIEQLKFVPQPTSKNLELGTVGKVHCKVQGTPTPNVKWVKELLEELPTAIEDINGTLVFKNVSSDDKGNYTCIATNSQGTINATVVINAVVAPRFVVAPEGVILAAEMGSTMVHCQATGDPKPTVQWDKDLQYITNNSTDSNRIHILENGTLHIAEVHLDDEGRYGCTIGSNAGLKREEARLTVKPADDFVSDESGDGFMITRAVLITMSVAFAYIILVVGLMLWCRYRRQARKARLNLIDKDAVENGNGEIKMGEIEPCLPDKSKSKKMNGGHHNNVKADSAQKSDDTVASNNSKTSKKSSNFDKIALPRNSLFELVQIGQGEFGDVFIGKIKTSDLKNVEKETSTMAPENENRKSKTSLDEIHEIKEEITDNEEYKQVLVKALNKVKDENICIEFRRQIEMFRAVSHRSVSKLYGLCRDKDPHYLVLEYTDWGDLKQYLMATVISNGSVKDVVSKQTHPLIPSQLLAIAHQISRGMDAIYRARYIHKDLAARNCIITSNLVVKVSYPALHKEAYSREYFKHKNVMIPLRWLAPECLNDDDYSTKSDIFAFGVLFWELYTRAVAIPFEDLTNEEFLAQAKESKLNWKLAEQTPVELSTILLSCWSNNVKERPSFSQLYSALGKCLQGEKLKELKE